MHLLLMNAVACPRKGYQDIAHADADMPPLAVQVGRSSGLLGGGAWSCDVQGSSAASSRGKVQLNEVICATMMSAYHRAGRFDQVQNASTLPPPPFSPLPNYKGLSCKSTPAAATLQCVGL